MRLNHKLPNRRLDAMASHKLAIFIIILAKSVGNQPASCQAIGRQTSATNVTLPSSGSLNYQSSHPPTDNNNASFISSSWPTREVTNLRMKSEFRAVKLEWTYNQPVRPAAFNIRYCELSFWNRAFRCVEKDLLVAAQREQQLKKDNANELNSRRQHQQMQSQLQKTWITRQQIASDITDELASDYVTPTDGDNLVYLSDDGIEYETTIRNLRAFTNYTFEVQVARFPNESLSSSSLSSLSHINDRHIGDRFPKLRPAHGTMAKFPEIKSGKQLNHSKRVETKPFGAEAVKCLANSSEVRVFTGRHFEGRISVEDSDDPRCELIGNKSSIQEVYLFRIDHEICHSKIMNNAVRTTILVQENKDLITHTSARYPVICDFSHEPMIVKTSLALPKIDTLTNQTPADQMANKWWPGFATKLVKTANGDVEQVRIGSIPGYFRPASSLASNGPTLSSQQRARNLRLAAASLSSASNNHWQDPYAARASNLSGLLTTASATISKQLDFVRPSDQEINFERLPRQFRSGLIEGPNSGSLDSFAIGKHQEPLQVAPLDQKLRQRIDFKMHEPVGVLRMPLQADHHDDGLSLASVGLHREAKFASAVENNDADNNAAQARTSKVSSSNHEAMVQDDRSRLAPIWIQPAPTTSNFAAHVEQPQQPDGMADGNSRRVYSNMKASSSYGVNNNVDQQQSVVTMTNNHRVAGDYMPLAQLQGGSRSMNSGLINYEQNQRNSHANLNQADMDSNDTSHRQLMGNYSINYSTNQVDEYPLDKIAYDTKYSLLDNLKRFTGQIGQRSGRGMFLGRDTSPTVNQLVSLADQSFSDRMGDLSVAESQPRHLQHNQQLNYDQQLVSMSTMGTNNNWNPRSSDYQQTGRDLYEPRLGGGSMEPLQEQNFKTPFDQFVATNLSFPVVIRSFKKLAAIAKAALEAMNDQNQTLSTREPLNETPTSAANGQPLDQPSSLQAPSESTKPMITTARSNPSLGTNAPTNIKSSNGSYETTQSGEKFRPIEHELDGFLVPSNAQSGQNKSIQTASNIIGLPNKPSIKSGNIRHHESLALVEKDPRENRTQKSLFSLEKSRSSLRNSTANGPQQQNATTKQSQNLKSTQSTTKTTTTNWPINPTTLSACILISIAATVLLVIYLNFSPTKSHELRRNNKIDYIFAPQMSKHCIGSHLSQARDHIGPSSSGMNHLKQSTTSKQNHYIVGASSTSFEENLLETSRQPKSQSDLRFKNCSSGSSTLLSNRENYCKTNEIVNTDHVILDQSFVYDDSSNESFA